MELVLNRTALASGYTGGLLLLKSQDALLPDKPICQTLEDTYRTIAPDGSGKINSQTAIPTGRYRVILSYSNRFKKVMPELVNVPHFLGIRIHTGNTVNDTDGCILVGARRKEGYLEESRPAYARLMTLLEAADRTKEKVFITIVNS